MQQDAGRAEARHAATRTYLAGLIAAGILGIAAGLGGPAALAARPAVPTATPIPAVPTPTPTSHRDTPSPTRSATTSPTACPSCPTATATATPACSGRWQIVGSPDPPGLGAGLTAAGGVAPDDLWAAGSSLSADSTVHPLIEHGDGTGWTIIPGPALADQGALQALAAIDVDDVWAAGQHDDGTLHPLIAHWDANAWAVVPSPDAPGRQIYALAAAGPADVWAAGSGGLAEHWDGTAWSIVPTGTSADLWALAALGPADVWAVGGSGNDTLTLHWDGSAWTTVPSPNLGTGHNELRGITAVAANDIWAVGSYQTDVAYYRTLLLHWDGTAWTAMAGPNAGAGDNSLVGIHAAGPADIWAAGEYFDTTTYRPLILHWDGATWRTVTAPGEGGLESLVAFGAGNVWATGYHWSPSSAGTLVEQWTIPCLTATPTRTGTPATATPSHTATLTPTITPTVPPTGTPTVTPTPTETRTSTETPRPSPTVTGTPPTATHTPTATWTPPPPTATPVGPTATGITYPTPTIGLCLVNETSAATSCTPPATYDFTFGFHVYAWGGVEAYLTYYFEVAATPNGPWTGLDQYSEQRTLPLGDSAVPGSFTETTIPDGYYYYRIRLDGNSCGNPLYGTTPPTPICSRPTPTATPNCATGWNAVDSPNNGTADNGLNAVAAVAPDDVWAAGTTGLSYTAGQTLVEHWDGSAWRIASSPNPGSSDNRLQAIAAPAPDEVWAVGSQANGGAEQTLTLHWDGTGWTVVPAPNPGSGENVLAGLTALSPTDLWAVGHYRDGGSGPIHTLILHGDGSTWTQVPSPDTGLPYNALATVAASGPQDVWAAGAATTAGSNPFTLIEHWDGSTWQVVPSPNPSGADNWISGLAALAPDNAWAVGSYFDFNLGYQTLILHWDGSMWTQVASPNVPSGYNYLSAIAGTASDLWATGTVDGGGTLVLHSTGGGWAIVGSPNSGARANALVGLARLGPTDVWAVGHDQDWLDAYRTLAEHFTGPCSTATATPAALPSASASPTPRTTHPPEATATVALTATPVVSASTTAGPPTGTPVPSASATPAASATPCGLGFSDVQPADYFYGPVAYLACQGVISGYADGTFRPYNATTRAQMVKIVVLGFGIPIATPPTPTFRDVPPANPFYAVIETAAAHGIVAGYADGTFRPYTDVTRGQLAKIVVGAAGWSLQSPPRGSFADVPPGSAFYPFVETAACHGIVSGYTCGGPSEPCDAAHRPYFRQSNPATRGQIAKIVYEALGAAQECAPPPE